MRELLTAASNWGCFFQIRAGVISIIQHFHCLLSLPFKLVSF